MCPRRLAAAAQPRAPIGHLLLLSGLVAIGLGLAGCKKDPPQPKVEAGASAKAAQKGSDKGVFKAGDPGNKAGSAAEPKAPSAPGDVSKLASVAAGAAVDVHKAGLAEIAKIAGEYKHTAKVLKTLYDKRKGEPLAFGPDGEPNADGKAALEVLRGLEAHGLPLEHYERAKLDEAIAKQRAAVEAERAALAAASGLELVLAKAVAVVRSTPEGDAAATAALAQAGAGKLGAAELGRAVSELEKIVPLVRATDLATLRADAAIVRGIVRYVVDFKWARHAHPTLYQTPAQVAELCDQKSADISKFFDESSGKLETALPGLWPKSPQYARLREALARYEQLDKDGKQKDVPVPAASAGKLKPKNAKLAAISLGATSPIVQAVKERLQIEGYWPAGELGADAEKFDEKLSEAIKKYQSNHAMDPSGFITKALATSLNVPFKQRAKVIRLALERWRESDSNAWEPMFVRVNLAAQWLELHEGGKITRRHRVVIGNNDRVKDERERKKGQLNHTRMFTRPMTQIVLAPKWFPTTRIVEEELEKDRVKRPDYYEKLRIEIETKPDGTQVTYQKPGPRNFLGDVKFLFPNPFGIYMHDTPFKMHFKDPVRLRSHGCMRVENPKDLAEYILEKDQGMSRATMMHLIREAEERTITLKQKIPVHIDYVTSSVDDDGVVQFWEDVYGYDRAYWSGQLPVREAEDLVGDGDAASRGR